MQYQNSTLCYLIKWMTKGFKCRYCVEEIKMKNDITINMSLCLPNDHS
jgi:hypothetical protein